MSKLQPILRPYLQEVRYPAFEKSGVQVNLLRLDVIHPGISGNKWYKLKYNIELAVSEGYGTILTFGGAYSNHIHASAIAASESGLNSIGVIRGERIEPLNPTLQDAEDLGMKLFFISRTQYKNKGEEDFLMELERRFGSFYLVPEGGTNTLAIKGAAEILNEIVDEFDWVITAVGTGGTMSGLVSGLKGNKKVIGIPVLKGDFLESEIKSLVFDYTGQYFENWSMINDYHFGGYAKFSEELISFINDFKAKNGIPLDPVYTGKMMYALIDLAEKGQFKEGSRIVALHTGGLQGIRGFNQRFGGILK